ncbi:MAG: helix-turn-helix domain-containing protein [Deltaproteobacteria bacterium]|nr:helix-turn-helix domain-containing protein [Deltaproteobacteria bacterium]
MARANKSPGLDTPWMTTTEAIAYLRSSRSAVYREIAAGRLVPDGRVGTSLRFHISTLDLFIRSGASITQDNLGLPPSESGGTNAHQTNEAAPDGRGRDPNGRNPVRRPRGLQRSEDRETKEEGEGGGVPGRSGATQGDARDKPSGTRAATVLRLRRAMDRGTR